MPKWWGIAKGRKANNDTYHAILIKKTDQVLLRICAGATKERHWQVIHRLILQEWHRLKTEQAAILGQGYPENPPIARWYTTLERPEEMIPEPGHPSSHARWQGSNGVPEPASVLERQHRQAVKGKQTGAPVVDELGRILDAGGEWREMTPQERQQWGRQPTLRERRAKRRAELEASLKKNAR